MFSSFASSSTFTFSLVCIISWRVRYRLSVSGPSFFGGRRFFPAPSLTGFPASFAARSLSSAAVVSCHSRKQLAERSGRRAGYANMVLYIAARKTSKVIPLYFMNPKPARGRAATIISQLTTSSGM